MRVMVTGAGGNIGRALVAHLGGLAPVETVYALYRDGQKLPALREGVRAAGLEHKVEFAQHDLALPLDRFAWGVEHIIHCAGLRSPLRCNRDYREAVSANILGTVHVAEFARDRKAKNLVFTSIQSVYRQPGLRAGGPALHSEDDPVEGADMYTGTKLAAETVIKTLLDGRVNYQILRLPHLVGCAEIDGVLKAFHDSAAQGFLTVHGSGRQTCCFLHIQDLCRLIGLILTSPPPPGIYNVCSETVGVGELAGCFQDVYRRRHNRFLRIVREEQAETRSYGLDISRIVSATGWRPAFRIRDLVEILAGAPGARGIQPREPGAGGPANGKKGL